MRSIVCAALAALTLGLIETGPAAAAASAYECMGPAASCVSATTKRVKARHATKAAKSYRKIASSKALKKRHVAKPSYSGGGYSGLASYYWQPQRVASGGWFNPNALTAAHKTLPFGTRVLVTNRSNGRSVAVTINDRGPYVRGRVIDLSSRAAGEIGMKGAGIVPVSISVIGRG